MTKNKSSTKVCVCACVFKKQNINVTILNKYPKKVDDEDGLKCVECDGNTTNEMKQCKKKMSRVAPKSVRRRSSSVQKRNQWVIAICNNFVSKKHSKSWVFVFFLCISSSMHWHAVCSSSQQEKHVLGVSVEREREREKMKEKSYKNREACWFN